MWKDLMGRDPLFPMWPLLSNKKDIKYWRGHPRLIVRGYYDPETLVIDDGFEDEITKEDILFSPLFEHIYRSSYPSHIGQPECQSCGLGVDDRCPAYDDNMRWIEKHGQKCRGITLGNAFSELSFKYLMFNMFGGATPRNLQLFEQTTVGFIQRTHEMLTSLGVREISYGLVEWDVAIDSYLLGGRIRNVMNELKSTAIVYWGYRLMSPSFPDPSDPVFHPMCPIENPDPAMMKRHIEGGKFLSGVNYLDGMISKKNDEKLRDFGFDGGVCGSMTSAIEEMLGIEES